MIIHKLWLNNFRSYSKAEFDLDKGLNAIVGPNGIGKTNLVEAICYLSKLKSFRGSPTQNLVAKGSESGVIRAKGMRDDREVLIEIQIAKGRSRVQVNKQPLKRSKDLLGALQVTVFAPDDLALIKDGPSLRRDYLDDLAIALDPRTESMFSTLDKVLKQRNSLLKQMSYKPDDASLSTLDVWDKRLAEVGTNVRHHRLELLRDLLPLINASYVKLAGMSNKVDIEYSSSWTGDLFDALQNNRDHDMRRKVTTAGPHRDDIIISLNDLDSRNEASQGEQRSLALALRIASHHLLFERLGEPPLLLLDDVLSELDDNRAISLLNNLPAGQTIITSATDLPEQVNPDLLIENFASVDLEWSSDV